MADIYRDYFSKVNFSLFKFKLKNVLGRLKPFDDLLLAYSRGLVQPKAFCFCS